MNEIITAGAASLDLASLDAQRLERFWAGNSPETRKAYAADLAHFARWGGYDDAASAVRALVTMGRGPAHEKVHTYIGELLERKRSPSQVNRRLTALRRVIDLCRQFGLCEWELEIRGVTSESYRDTRGPGLSGLTALLAAARIQERPDKVARDVAIIRLLFDIALRRAEVAELDLSNVDLSARRISILGKGRRERELLTLPTQTCAALTAWIALRGDDPGPLFRNMDPARKGDGRLTGDGIFRVIRALGKAAGLKVRPHGLRHSAITQALDVARGDMRAAQRFSRHRNINTLKHYDDNRTDMGGELACSVASSLDEEK